MNGPPAVVAAQRHSADITLLPARALPCNGHDVCYQTLGTSQIDYDDQTYTDMQAVCFRAYPPDIIGERPDGAYGEGRRHPGEAASEEIEVANPRAIGRPA